MEIIAEENMAAINTEINIYNISAAQSKMDSAFSDFMKNYFEIVLQLKSIMKDLSEGRCLDYNRIIGITDMIYMDIDKEAYILKCLQQVHNTFTDTHSINTAFYSMLMAKWLELPAREIWLIIQAGILHDIGKAKIPPNILYKKDIITKDEYEQLKKHAIIGYDILNDIDRVPLEVKRAVLLHHERTNRSGYPLNADADCVNLYTKIVAVADVYDAMTSDRVYKKRATPSEAFEMFRTVGVEMYDEAVREVFLKQMEAYCAGSVHD